MSEPRGQQAATDRPLPEITPLTEPFWKGAQQRKLVIQRCDDCGTWRFPPELGCYECGSPRFTWTEASGRAKLFSWTLLHPPVLPFFKSQLPYPVAIVELEEGTRMATNLVGVPAEDYRMDLPLKVTFEDVAGEDVTLVFFERA